MRVKYIIFKLNCDPFFNKVVLFDNSFFYVPFGYTRGDILSMVNEHNQNKRFIHTYKFLKGVKYDTQ